MTTNLREHDERSETKVWLWEEETPVLAAAEDTERRIAFYLGARCVLRSGEWFEVTSQDVVDTDDRSSLPASKR